MCLEQEEQGRCSLPLGRHCTQENREKAGSCCHLAQFHFCQRTSSSKWQGHTPLEQKEPFLSAEAVRDTESWAQGWERPLQIHAFPPQLLHQVSLCLKLSSDRELPTCEVNMLILQALLRLRKMFHILACNLSPFRLALTRSSGSFAVGSLCQP